MADKKTCTQCGEYKALDEFQRNRTNKDGRRTECRECSRRYEAARRAYRGAEPRTRDTLYVDPAAYKQAKALAIKAIIEDHLDELNRTVPEIYLGLTGKALPAKWVEQ